VAATPLQDLETVEKTSLKDHAGLSFTDFRRGLSPRYTRVFLDLLLGYACLFLSLYVPFRLGLFFPRTLPLWVLMSGFSIGYWIAYLHLFMHEAAHYNIAPDRKWNDFLSNLFISSWSGQNTASYRAIHWDHHRFLGQPNDTEHSYFNALNLRFLLGSLTGFSALKVVLFRGKKLEKQRTLLDRLMPAAGLALNGLVVWALIRMNARPFALAWAMGIVLFFPFFGALRQLLEHRGEKADPRIDYSQVPHGKVSRMFKEGPLDSLLGAAGFTRHLLHHWDPQISYTRLAEVERFLKDTELGAGLSTARTTYLRTFFKLFEW